MAKLVIYLIATLLCCGVNRAAFAQTRPATDPTDDPRPALGRFFDAVRRADKVAAVACWDNDVEDNDQRRYVEDLVGHLVDEMIASHHFEQALALKLPDAYEKARQSGGTPTPAEVAAAHFIVYRRLAIVRWGHDEDDGFPMEFDSRVDARIWKISMRQWHATNRSSVGDSMLLSGFGAKAKNATTKEILEGKFKTIEAVQDAFLHHLTEVAEAAEKATKAPTNGAGKH